MDNRSVVPISVITDYACLTSLYIIIIIIIII